MLVALATGSLILLLKLTGIRPCGISPISDVVWSIINLGFLSNLYLEAASDQSSSQGGLWAENGTGSRLFGGLVNGDAHAQSSSQDRNHLGAKPKQVIFVSVNFKRLSDGLLSGSF